ncbi:MAG: SRPBCC family protein [Anaerolineales bacterium]
MNIEHGVEISKPPELVFPWISDPDKAMQWQKNVKGGEILVETPDKIGTTFKETIEEDGNELEMHGSITEYVEGKLIGFHIESRIHTFVVRYLVKEIEGGSEVSTEINIRWKFPMNVMSLFIGKKMEATLLEGIETEFRALKQICEME